MSELLILSALLSAALLVGNEFTIGAFINPAFDRLPERPQAYAARETARVFGRVMTFWMPLNFLLSAALAVAAGARLYAAAAALFAVVIVFSLVFPVPLNNRIAAWDPEAPPADWRALRARWDRFHYVRIVLLLGALACLIWGTVNR